MEDRRIRVGLLVLSSKKGAEGSKDRRVRLGLLVPCNKEGWGTAGTGG